MDVANCQEANEIDLSLALNAVKIVWTPGLHRPVLDVAIRCLPFDFCSKEDMNGIPLMLQIDSFLENERGIMGTKLINRSFCPIRTFVRYVNNSFFVLRMPISADYVIEILSDKYCVEIPLPVLVVCY